MAEVNVNKLAIYVKELNDLTNQINARRKQIDNQLPAIRSIWNDEISGEYFRRYEALSAEIGVFVSQSQKTQNTLNQKILSLRRYLSTR